VSSQQQTRQYFNTVLPVSRLQFPVPRLPEPLSQHESCESKIQRCDNSQWRKGLGIPQSRLEEGDTEEGPLAASVILLDELSESSKDESMDNAELTRQECLFCAAR
jgi:hypothetical protein